MAKLDDLIYTDEHACNSFVLYSPCSHYIFMGFSLLLDVGLLLGSKVAGEFINDE